MGADNAVTSCDLRILVEEAAKPVASSDADVGSLRRDVGPAVGWFLVQGPVRPVAVVVIDVFAEGAVEMSPAGDEDAVGALAPRAGDPPLADRVRPRRLNRRPDDAHADGGEDLWMPKILSTSCDLPVFVDKASESVVSADPDLI